MKIDNRGFTLIELLATIILLTILMGLGGYTIISLINDSREKDYKLLIDDIKNATSTYYMECKYSSSSMINCPSVSEDGYYQIKLSDLVTYGYISSNATSDDTNKLVNPKDNVDISECVIKYQYDKTTSKLVYTNVTSSNSSCPVMD